MKRIATVMLMVAGLAGASSAYAQETQPTEGAAVVTIIPGGAVFMTTGKNTSGPSFGSYNLGGAVTGRITKNVGIEGEVTGVLGVSQSLDGFTTTDTRTPHMVNYSGNLVVSMPAGSGVVPYVTGGVGGMTVFDKADLGINTRQTFLTGNVGAGVKWYAGRWGVRADYRFIAIRANDTAPAFFGNETRYAHRIYGGVLLNLGR